MFALITYYNFIGLDMYVQINNKVVHSKSASRKGLNLFNK